MDGIIAKKTFYNLQIGRGIAAILVLLAHANGLINKFLFNGILLVGWSGVDFFFVLSGFIIFYVNHDLLNQRKVFRSYIKRRLLRIYPVYWISLIGIITVYVFFWIRYTIRFIHLDFSLLVRSFFLWPTHTPVELPINPVAWTLTYEIFFYSLFGLSILVTKQLRSVLLISWLASITLGLFIEINQPIFRVLTNPRNLEFLFGCFAAYLALKQTAVNSIMAWSLLIIGLILLGTAWIIRWQGDTAFGKFDFVNFGLPFTLLVYGLVCLENSRRNKIKSAFIFLGNASYSIYLTHYILIQALIIVLLKFQLSHIVLFCVAVPICLVFGCLFYFIFEKPIIKFFSKKYALPISVTPQDKSL